MGSNTKAFDNFGAFTLCNESVKFGIFGRNNFNDGKLFCQDRKSTLGPVRGNADFLNLLKTLVDEKVHLQDNDLDRTFFLGVSLVILEQVLILFFRVIKMILMELSFFKTKTQQFILGRQ